MTTDEKIIDILSRVARASNEIFVLAGSDLQRDAAEVLSALSTPPAGEWVLVPRKLTESMTRAFATSPSHPDGRQRLQLAWDAMLAASTPEPATQEVG